MARLPPLPDLSFADGPTPRAAAFGDVYFSALDGLAEAETVFLQGCGLPDAWAGRERFTVGELGFGTGLNVLALLRLWAAHRPSPLARLNILTVEGYLMPASAAAQAHARWPELSAWSEALCGVWPVRMAGLQRANLPELGVSLTFAVGEVTEALGSLEGAVDAWFLDGFSPAKNPQMWTPEVFAHLARLSAPGARLGTFTVAGAVRRGLTEAGFTVRKAQGFGHKRDRLVGVRAPPDTPESPPQTPLRAPLETPVAHPSQGRVAVVGAGIGGVLAALALQARGVAVTLIEADEPGSGASGNPLGLVMPRLDATDGPLSRLLVSAFVHAVRFYKDLPADLWETVEVAQLTTSDVEVRRAAKVLADPPLDADWLGALPGEAGLCHRNGLILKPAEVVRHLAERFVSGGGKLLKAEVTDLRRAGDRWRVAELEADAVVLAAGAATARLDQAQVLPLVGRLGQVDWHADTGPPLARTSGSYVLRAGGIMLYGATFGPDPGGPPCPTPEASAENRASLAALAADLAEGLPAGTHARAGVRATLPDRLPLVGPMPDASGAVIPGLWVLGGFGARGLAWAPLLAELLADLMTGDPPSVPEAARKLISPLRFAARKPPKLPE
jgi:tRNA 5-methylaminomethyl-2-thiouridine biosynthesis bifunctional protein